jgi:transcription elongation factor GreA
MTAQGAQRLRDELHRLKTVERPRITNAIAEARALGDLKENAEYHAAREQQSFTEGRIADIEGKLGSAEIIDVTAVNAQGRVVFGATVQLLNLSNDSEVTYRIVGEDEASVKENRISVTSPMARSLVGKEIGDVVSVRTPAGPVDYEIVDVLHL